MFRGVCFLCKDYFSLPKSKIRVLGQKTVDIPSLILRATKVDVNVYVERERFAICRTKCYNRLVRYQNALRKFEEVGAEIQQDCQCDNSVRVKRLAKEPGTLPEAKKSPKFEDTSGSIETRHGRSRRRAGAVTLSTVLDYKREINAITKKTVRF